MTKLISLPVYAKNYLLNQDDSGLSHIDKLLIDFWVSLVNPVIISCDDIAYFCYTPVFGLECDCVDCRVSYV